MTIGHRLEADELSDTSVAELYAQLGAGDTPELYEQAYDINTEYDCPTGAGNSLDRKTVYFDRLLYQEVMDGEFKSTGLSPPQIIRRWCDHEHSEICLSYGDNCVDTYEPCHDRALKKEHLGVLDIRCPKDNADAKRILKEYEATIWPGLFRAYHRPVAKAPRDYWCGPLLDKPTDRDEEILATLRGLGVIDAAKYSKYEMRYGFGGKKCVDCTGWYPGLVSQERGQLAACYRISGLVRDSRWCEMWDEKKGK